MSAFTATCPTDPGYLGERAVYFNALAEHFGCKLKIYGSFATGCAGPDSDIDILIPSPPIGELQRRELHACMERLFERAVDLVEEQALFRILRRRILAEAISIESILAGNLSTKTPKSPYLYLFVIQGEARKIMRERHAAGKGDGAVCEHARRLSYVYVNRLRPLAPPLPARQFPLRQMRAIARIGRLADARQRDQTRAAAQIRRLSRTVAKRLKLTHQEVEARIRGAD